jgi:uncharacterized protein YcbK (DUF882 family)
LALLPIILKIRLATAAMASWSAAASPVPLPAETVAMVVAEQAAGPVEVTVYDENDHQAGALAIWRDGSTDDATKADVKRLFRCRTTLRQKMLADKTLEMLAAVSERYGNRVIEYISAYRVGYAESSTSPHRDGRAIDFRIRGVPLRDIRDYLWRTYVDVGVGWYPSEQFVHIDTRPGVHDTSWTFIGGANHYHPYWAELVRKPHPEIATTAVADHHAGS